MYDITLRKQINPEINTAKDLAYFLLETCPDAKIEVLGDPMMYIHVEQDKSVVSFDDSSLSYLDEYQNNDTCNLLFHYEDTQWTKIN